MKKTMMVLALALVVVICGGAITAYASEILDVDVVNLIRNKIGELKAAYTGQAASETTGLMAGYEASVDQLVDDAFDRAQARLEGYKAAEIQRADEVLSQYVEELRGSVDAEVEISLEGVQTEIGEAVDKEIESIMKDLAKALSDKVKMK